MSQQLISHNDDLQRLQSDGYGIEIRAGHLLLKRVLYVNANREVKRGVLVSALEVNAERVVPPAGHVALFAGEEPCDKDGRPLGKVIHSRSRKEIDGGFATDFMFSSKLRDRAYRDYHEKMTAYVKILSGAAQAIDPSATAAEFRPVRADEAKSVFHYMDTASARAGINVAADRIALPKIAIVGVGGTGSYVLDLVAKTPVGEIHLFDGDRFSNHNAFRAPGAASYDELDALPQKVSYFAGLYSRMRRNVVPHDVYVTESNAELLSDMSFVFLCSDGGTDKRAVIAMLERRAIPFIDVGMGLFMDDEGKLGGQIRTTAGSSRMPGRADGRRIPFSDALGDGDYRTSIQIAELNALNGALAVIKWKKMFGFYQDLEGEHFSVYQIDGNSLINDDKP